MIFFNENFFQKDSDIFCHRKLTLKVRILQFLTTFTQLTTRLKNFLISWLLVLGLKEGKYLNQLFNFYLLVAGSPFFKHYKILKNVLSMNSTSSGLHYCKVAVKHSTDSFFSTCLFKSVSVCHHLHRKEIESLFF